MKNICLVLFLGLGCFFSSCEKEDIEPKEMIIRSITLVEYPSARSNGSGWDAFNGPDIYLTFDTGESSNANSFVTGVNENTTLNQGVIFQLNNPILVSNLNQRYVIGAYDDDGIGYQENMGGISFIPSSYKEDLPNTIILDVGDMIMTLDVTWTI